MTKFHFFFKKVKFSRQTKKSEIHKKNSEKKHYGSSIAHRILKGRDYFLAISCHTLPSERQKSKTHENHSNNLVLS